MRRREAALSALERIMLATFGRKWRLCVECGTPSAAAAKMPSTVARGVAGGRDRGGGGSGYGSALR
jgi:hypothetical protein